jgi:hypothetical protein
MTNIIMEALFDELEKIGGLTEAIVENLIQNPLKYVAASNRWDKGVSRHKKTMEALKYPYPASWALLGMRPTE